MRHHRPLIGISSDWQDDRRYGASFLRVRPEYPEAVRDSGGVPVILPYLTDENVIQDLLENLDGILLSGGGDIDPALYGMPLSDLTKHVVSQRDSFENILVTRAIAEEIPLLAICRGHQMVNVSLGGSLYQDIAEELRGHVTHNLAPSEGGFENLAHDVVVATNSRLSGVMNGEITGFQVNSLHHQGVKDLAPALRASAWAPDGLVEGIELPDHPFLIGVQWHPESLYRHQQAMHNLFMSFIHAAIKHR